MKRSPPSNIAASHRAKLLKLAHEGEEDFQILLTPWTIERFLYRLSISAQHDHFILKGAMLFALWRGPSYRPTKDLDLLGFGSPDHGRVSAAVREICETPVADGLIFQTNQLQIEAINEDGDYQGVRVKVPVLLDKARVVLQVDIGFGDTVVPDPEVVEFPVLLPLDAPKLRAYPAETVIAEKFHAMVILGMANSRMKDFYDIWNLAEGRRFEMIRLRQAIESTFSNRKTPLPTELPLALTPIFLEDSSKSAQWKAFLNRIGVDSPGLGLREVGEHLIGFLQPAVDGRASRESTNHEWQPGGPWLNV